MSAPILEYKPGDIIDERYRVERIAGRGGFARVYEARELATDRRVALKVLEFDARSGYQPQTQSRIDRELRVLGRLRGGHSVRLLTFGRDAEGRVYLVFEYVDGRDLSELLAAHGRLAVPVVTHVLRQVLRALDEAHREGLVHRDIKPENIRVFTEDGDPWRVKLLDFGIARGFGPAEAHITATGELIGTPRYMAPEQLLDQPVGPTADLYSLGLVGFEMLAGRAALHGNAWGDQFDRLQTGYLFSVGEAPLGHELEAILRRMTARAPQGRYQSADAVLAALERLDLERAPAAPLPPRAAGPGPARRGPMIGLLAVVAILVITIVVIGRRDENQPVGEDVRPIQGAPDRTRTSPLPAEVPIAAPKAPERGCGAPPPFAGTRRSMRAMDGLVSREWLTYIPASYAASERHPLLVLLHQDGEPAATLLTATGFETLAEEHRFVIAAPLDGHPAWRDNDAAENDLDWVRDHVVGTLQRDLCIDPERIYVVGHSQGGRLAERLTCVDWVAAVATHSFRLRSGEPTCQNPKRYIAMSPRFDRHTPFEGGTGCGPSMMSVAEFEAHWRARNRCTGERTRVIEDEGGVCSTWTCEASFVSCHLEGGHQWPGAPPRDLFADPHKCDGDPAKFPSAERIWSFFASVEAAEP